MATPRLTAVSAGQNIVNASSITVTLATGTTNDLAVIICEMEAAVNGSTCGSGWTQLTGSPRNQANSESLIIWYKIRGSSEANPSLAFNDGTGPPPGAVSGRGYVRAFNFASGTFNATTPIDGQVFNSGSSTTATITGLAPTVMGAYRLGVACSASSTVVTAASQYASGFRTLVNTAYSSYNMLYVGGCQMQHTSSDGNHAVTVANNNWVTCNLLIKPQAASTFGILRFAYYSTAGTGSASGTATLQGAHISGNVSHTTVIADASCYSGGGNTVTGFTVGGTSYVGNKVARNANTCEASILYALDQTATAGSNLAVVCTTSGGSADSLEFSVAEWAGLDGGGALDVSGTNAGTTTTTETVSTSSASTSGTRLSVAVFSCDVNPATYADDSVYEEMHVQQSGAGGYSTHDALAREFSGGSTETCDVTANTADYAAAIAVFKPSVTTVAMQGSGVVALGGSANLTDREPMHGAGSVSVSGSAVLNDARALMQASSSVSLGGSGVLRSVLRMAAAGVVAITGSGALAVHQPMQGAGSIEVVGSGVLQAPTAYPMQGSGSITLNPPSLVARSLAAYTSPGWRIGGTLGGSYLWGEADVAWDGSEYHHFGTYPADSATVWRHAPSLEGLADATATTLSTGVNAYYPTVARDPDTGRWFVFGTESGGGGETFLRYSDSLPTMSDQHVVARGKVASFYTAVGIVDAQTRRSPADGKWYMVGLWTSNTTGCCYIIKLNYALPMAPDGTWWQMASAGTFASPTDIFNNIGRPSWASYTIADPNLMFSGGQCFLYFSAWDGDPAAGGHMTAAMVEIDQTTWMARGAITILGDSTHPGWRDRPPTDAALLACPDGVERLIASEGQNLAILDLPPAAYLQARYSAQGAGSIALSGSGALRSAHSMQGAGFVELSGSGSLTARYPMQGAGQIEVTGQGALSIPASGMQGAGEVALSGSGVLSSAYSMAGEGSVEVTGSANLIPLEPMAGQGTVEISGRSYPDYDPMGAHVVQTKASMSGTPSATLTCDLNKAPEEGNLIVQVVYAGTEGDSFTVTHDHNDADWDLLSSQYNSDDGMRMFVYAYRVHHGDDVDVGSGTLTFSTQWNCVMWEVGPAYDESYKGGQFITRPKGPDFEAGPMTLGDPSLLSLVAIGVSEKGGVTNPLTAYYTTDEEVKNDGGTHATNGLTTVAGHQEFFDGSQKAYTVYHIEPASPYSDGFGQYAFVSIRPSPVVAVQGSGSVGISGVGAITFPSATLQGQGVVEVSGIATLRSVYPQAGSGSITISGAGALRSAHRMAAQGAVDVAGLGVMRSAHDMAGAGSIDVVGAAALRHLYRAAAQGIVEISGTGYLTQQSTTLQARGVVEVLGTGRVVSREPIAGSGQIALFGLGVLRQVNRMTAAQAISLLGSATLRPLYRAQAVGSVTVSGAGLMRQVVRLAASNAISVLGAGAMREVDRMVGSGTIPVTGSGAMTLKGQGLVGYGVVTVTGMGAITTPNVPMQAQGTITVPGTGTIRALYRPLGSGIIILGGSAALRPVYRAVGTSTLPVQGTGLLRSALRMAGAGQVALSGSAVARSALRLQGVGTVPLSGSGLLRQVLHLQGTGSIGVIGTADARPVYRMAGAGVIQVVGLARVLEPNSCLGEGIVEIVGVGVLSPTLIGPTTVPHGAIVEVPAPSGAISAVGVPIATVVADAPAPIGAIREF